MALELQMGHACTHAGHLFLENRKLPCIPFDFFGSVSWPFRVGSGLSDHPAEFSATPDRPGIAYADLRVRTHRHCDHDTPSQASAWSAARLMYLSAVVWHMVVECSTGCLSGWRPRPAGFTTTRHAAQSWSRHTGT